MEKEKIFTEFLIGNASHLYVYFAIAFALCFWWVLKSKAANKLELFFLSFYLMTGNVNEILTLQIPGLSLFEIQPQRFLFLIFSFFLIRKLLFSKKEINNNKEHTVPWFQVFLVLYISYIILSQLTHVQEIELSEIILEALFAISFFVFIMASKWLVDKAAIELIGKAIITGAVFSSLIGFYQIAIEPEFMRVGDYRIAFGELIRSNGLFSTEYFNSYFLITAVAWTLISIKKDSLKIILILIFSAGVICTFQRMSWLVLALVLGSYFLFIKKIALEKIIVSVLLLATVLLASGIYFHDAISRSQLVKERLNEPIDSRYGYYGMVINHIGEKPIFGFGGRHNDVYYYNMLKITKSRARATGEEGSIHNGYLESMFYYGIPALLLFILFLGTVFIYFISLLSGDLFFSIPLLVVLIYIVANLTNTFAFSSYLSILLAIHIGIGLAYKRIWEKEIASQTNVKAPVEQPLPLRKGMTELQ